MGPVDMKRKGRFVKDCIGLKPIGGHLVLKHSTKFGFAAFLLMAGLQANGAHAAFNGSAIAAAAAEQAAVVDPVRWVCIGNRCDWRPGHPGRPHPWALTWAPPRLVGCYYERVRRVWVEVCR
jgi:hypothetical protein